MQTEAVSKAVKKRAEERKKLLTADEEKGKIH